MSGIHQGPSLAAHFDRSIPDDGTYRSALGGAERFSQFQQGHGPYEYSGCLPTTRDEPDCFSRGLLFLLHVFQLCVAKLRSPLA
jgi:hypothetical protein